ncbi:amino acid permease -like protein [Moniliophthora roreri MCA 2997]|uniref:Amino acid permease-like protein n=1 Tax=Moniliophthora roreri (strain MCA 2997) TaxID=1381753 RepID=V2Z3D5_MONRO|nr:amino acid permease -like protein [Moniliophthora roreri MCA 2997]
MPHKVPPSSSLQDISDEDGSFRARAACTDSLWRDSDPPSHSWRPSLLADSSPEEKSPPVKLSTSRLLMAHFGAALTLFLATTDATIVSTMLPSIVGDLQANATEYTWIGVAYMLTQTACQPLYGRVSDIIGRKQLLCISIAIFAMGSLFCGVSQNVKMLIASRALSGIGGGGIVSCVWVITSEIVAEEHNSAKWSQALSVTWCCSAVAGPLLGGIFSDGSRHLMSFPSWRWGFYLNLPVCIVGLLVLLVSLRNVHLRPVSEALWDSLLRRFDFGGLFLFMGGTSCIIVGFSFATGVGWNAPSTIVLVVLGLLVLGLGGYYEACTTRETLFPPTIFRNFDAVGLLVIVFLHNFAFNAGTFYLALFYQAADGLPPLQAGIQMLPYTLGSSLASMPAAWFIGFWQKRNRNTCAQRWVTSFGLIICTLGFGLLNLVQAESPNHVKVIFPLVAGTGLGLLFHAPYQIFTKALNPCELATGTSAFFLIRFTGATIGISVAGAIFDARTASLNSGDLESIFSGSSVDIGSLKALEAGPARDRALDSITLAIQMIWIVCTSLLGIAFMISLLLGKLSIEGSATHVNPVPEKTPIDASSV